MVAVSLDKVRVAIRQGIEAADRAKTAIEGVRAEARVSDRRLTWLSSVVLDVVTIAEIEGQLLFKLISDENLSDKQLDEFLAEAERLPQEWQTQAE